MWSYFFLGSWIAICTIGCWILKFEEQPEIVGLWWFWCLFGTFFGTCFAFVLAVVMVFDRFFSHFLCRSFSTPVFQLYHSYRSLRNAKKQPHAKPCNAKNMQKKNTRKRPNWSHHITSVDIIGGLSSVSAVQIVTDRVGWDSNVSQPLLQLPTHQFHPLSCQPIPFLFAAAMGHFPIHTCFPFRPPDLPSQPFLSFLGCQPGKLPSSQALGSWGQLPEKITFFLVG